MYLRHSNLPIQSNSLFHFILPSFAGWLGNFGGLGAHANSSPISSAGRRPLCRAVIPERLAWTKYLGLRFLQFRGRFEWFSESALLRPRLLFGRRRFLMCARERGTLPWWRVSSGGGSEGEEEEGDPLPFATSSSRAVSRSGPSARKAGVSPEGAAGTPHALRRCLGLALNSEEVAASRQQPKATLLECQNRVQRSCEARRVRMRAFSSCSFCVWASYSFISAALRRCSRSLRVRFEFLLVIPEDSYGPFWWRAARSASPAGVASRVTAWHSPSVASTPTYNHHSKARASPRNLRLCAHDKELYGADARG